METALSLYKEYIDDKQYVYYKNRDNIIIMKLLATLEECDCNDIPKKNYCDKLKVVLIFKSDDPYKLVSSSSHYSIDDEVEESHCYLTIENAYNHVQKKYHMRD